MKTLLVVIGLVVLAVGAVELAYAAFGIAIPHVSFRIDDAFGYIPVPTTYTAIAVVVIGVLVLLFGGLRSEMGKYFNFY